MTWQTTGPEGTGFVAISAGGYHSLAIQATRSELLAALIEQVRSPGLRRRPDAILAATLD